MSLSDIKALTFDTGGTVLDWHTGFRDAFAAAGRRHGIERDWAAMANELRRRSLSAMLDLGKDGPPDYNFDDAHRSCLDALLTDEGLDAFDQDDRHAIAWEAPHAFRCWPDVSEGLAAIRRSRIAVSFTILSYRLIIDTARANGLTWDAVLSCEGLGVYKLLPASYQRAAAMLQLSPDQCLMVACHPFDLDAAAAVGFRTAYVRRPREWGPEDPLSGNRVCPNDYDSVVESFTDLAAVLDN